MKILVTGGGGFLGQAIVKRLLARGDQVRVLNRRHYPKLEALGVDCRVGDVADRKAVVDASRGVEAIFHVAAKAGSGLDRAAFYAANVDGTDHVLAACQTHGIAHLIYTSSPSVVHTGGDIEGGDESLPYPDHFVAPYPETKALAEQRVLAASALGLNTIALRPHLIWGPGDNQLLPRLIEKNRRGIRLPAPDKLIDTVYIDNAADAHIQALTALQAKPSIAGRAYFISNGEPMAIQAVMGQLLEAAGQVPRIQSVSLPVAKAMGGVVEGVWRALRLTSEPPVSRFVVEHLSTAHWYRLDRARDDLGYAPQVSMAQGFERLRERK
jgi:nucleoside-diphosphate-sugar epimerase